MDYTPKISAIVTVARMLVLYQAKREREDEVARLMEQDAWSREDAEEQAPSHFELVKKMANRFMTLTSHGGNPSPMDWMLRLRTYGMKIRYDTNADGVIEWRGDKLLFGHISFTMPALRSMVHGLVEMARMELLKDVLLLDVNEDGKIAEGNSQLPAIDWGGLVDNPAEMRSGWNFLKDPRNMFGGVKGDSWLTQRIVEEPRLREEFVDVQATNAAAAAENGDGGGGGVVWRSGRVREWVKAVRLSKERDLVLVHMTGGLPARGAELVTIQFKNSANGESRGVFVEDGMMAAVTMYHKGIGANKKAKIIHRYLPREVGELVLYHMWLVMPFWRKLETAFTGGGVGESSAFLWEPVKERPWVT